MNNYCFIGLRSGIRIQSDDPEELSLSVPSNNKTKMSNGIDVYYMN